MIVYAAISPSNKYYIGISSKNLEERKNQHFTKSKVYKNKFYDALKKYDYKFIWIILEEVDNWNSVCELEKYYIQKFNSFENGYNMTFGGEGNLGYKHSEESKNKMRGKRNFTPYLKGKTHTKEAQRKMKEAKQCKSFIAKNRTTNEIFGPWTSTTKCAEDLNIGYSNISSCLSKRIKSYKNYIFSYVED